MSEQPAERLARVKRQHPLWTIRNLGDRWAAYRGDRTVRAATVTELGELLHSLDSRGRVRTDAAGRPAAEGQQG